MSAQSGTPDPNMLAMQTTEPLDIDAEAVVGDLINDGRPFDYLTDDDTDTDNASLPHSRRWAWYCKDPACPKYWAAWCLKTNFWLHLYETPVHRADVRTHTRAGRRDLAKSWRVETDWGMKEAKQAKPTANQDGATPMANQS